MRVHYGFENLPPGLKNTAVAVGSFDGVHRGHRLLIGQLADIARGQNLTGGAVIVTFDPHPRLVLRGENRLLSTLPEKLELLAETQAEHVIVVNFTPEFSRIESDAFTRDYLIGLLDAQVVLSGDGHHFGHNRSGTADQLEGQGIGTHYTGRYENISSTDIRTAIERGEMEAARDMLGGGYLIRTGEPHDPTKLLPPSGDYTVLIDRDIFPKTLRIDDSIFNGPFERVRIIG